MTLALFDLDNTLLAGDSDYLWGTYLCELGVVDAEEYERENERFYAEYRRGELDIFEFLAFSLKPLAENSIEDLHRWRAQFIEHKILPLIHDEAKALVEKHREAGNTLLIITATNAFVTSPIAELFKIDELIATNPEMIDGRYTGNVAGTPSYQQGKVERLQTWLEQHDENLKDSYFYSDSHNDLPLLEQVTFPFAVDPDEKLAEVSTQRDWPILHLHGRA
ncbi:MAG: histidinol-phosphatase, partial [bacterium]